jgi:tetratricopeptide (TPR) repeat protein
MSQFESAVDRTKPSQTEASTWAALADLARLSKTSSWKASSGHGVTETQFPQFTDIHKSESGKGSKEFFCGAGHHDQPVPNSQETLLFKGSRRSMEDKDYKGAEKQLNDLLDLRKKLYGEKSPQVADTLASLGSVCELDSRYADAKGYYKQSAEVCANAFGKEKFETGTQIQNVARMDQLQKNWKDAAGNYKEAIRIYEKNEPSTDNYYMTETTKALNLYADVLTQLGDKQGADAQRQRAKDIYADYLRGPVRPSIQF